MPKICYQPKNFSATSNAIITKANSILREYSNRGIVVTLRQLYYQFVARDIIPNKQSEYKRLGSIINDARLAGLIDWDYLQDRTRNLQSQSSWTSPAGIIESAAASYHRDLWEGQPNHVEVFVEKDALLSVIENVCNRWDVAFFACRGYTSQSEMWAAGQRIVKEVIENGRNVRIIHLGDHDPSGVDMTRDIDTRLSQFLMHHYVRDYVAKHPGTAVDTLVSLLESALQIDRIALNMDQIEQYDPPPNPAKLTDSRATGYIEEFGGQSWELDALDPDVLTDLIESSITRYVDLAQWEAAKERQEQERVILTRTSEHWGKVANFVETIR